MFPDQHDRNSSLCTQIAEQASSSPDSNGSSHVIVVVNGNPNIGFFIVLNLNPVGISFVPRLQDPTFGKGANVGINGVTDVEAELLCLAFHEALLERFMVEVAADEHETFAHLIVLPQANLSAEIAAEEQNAMEDALFLDAFDGEHALVSEEILSVSRIRLPLFAGFVDVQFPSNFMLVEVTRSSC